MGMPSVFHCRVVRLFAVVVCLASAACSVFDARTANGHADRFAVLPGQATGTMTTARATFGEALNDFLNQRPAAEQPLEFPHNVHIAKQVACEVCHEGVRTGPVAGLPGVRTCVICHDAIATDRPRIKQILSLRDKGVDLAWQRVYGFSRQAHVRFHHGAHVRAGVACATCHGNLSAQTVAERVVDHTMGFCVNCHEASGASRDCLTCHN